MKTQPCANLCAIPQPIGATLTEIAPSIAFSVSRQIDHSFRWDGDGPDPANDGFNPYDVTIRARAIVRGQVLEGNGYLGASYFKPDEPTGDVHGYLLQMLDEAARELQHEMRRWGQCNEAANQIERVLAYLKAAMRDAYEAQRATWA